MIQTSGWIGREPFSWAARFAPVPYKVIKLRHRFIFTRNNRLRLRYAALSGVMGVLALAGVSTQMTALVRGVNVSQSKVFDIVAIEPASRTEPAGDWQLAGDLQSRISGGIRKASEVIQKRSIKARSREIEIATGDTLAGALQAAGATGDDAFKAVKAISEHFDPRMIRAGQKIDVQFRPAGASEAELSRLTLNLDPLKTLTVSKRGDDFQSNLDEKELQTKTFAASAEVQSSLYGSAARAGIPQAVIADLIRLYSRSIDFQRDIRQGDRIEVMYDGKQTEDGNFVSSGNILYASLTVGGRNMAIYRYETPDGRADYYTPDGRTTRKTLLTTPIDGARISSGFGMRRHPILGYSKMHKGMDFAAPTGTPIYAAGDGKVDFAGRKNGYGNYLALRHNSSLKTAYAHLSRFAKGIRPGVRVRQGQIVAYVGTTGRSTGPHLHYEVVVEGRQVNPRSVDLPTGEHLKGKDLDRFKRAIGGVRQQYASLAGQQQVAQAAEAGNSAVN